MEDKLSGKYIAPRPTIKVQKPGASTTILSQSTGRRLSPTSERMQAEINKMSLPQNSPHPPILKMHT